MHQFPDPNCVVELGVEDNVTDIVQVNDLIAQQPFPGGLNSNLTSRELVRPFFALSDDQPLLQPVMFHGL